MSIRAYLILSYLTIILVLVASVLAVSNLMLDRLEDLNVRFATQGVRQVTEANGALAERILTELAEKAMENKADSVAREITYLLGGRKSYDYAKLRKNAFLRRIATQTLYALKGPAGYVDLLDRHGVAVLHPNKDVEGKNFVQWADRFPEMWRLVSRSFSDPLVKGYYAFIDENNQERQKFMVLRQVPDTPFIVAVAVNIDEFFTPVQSQIQATGREITVRAQQAIQKHHDQIDRTFKIVGLLGGIALCLAGGLFGLFFAATISRPLRTLRNGVRELGEGNFAVAVPARGAKEAAELANAFNRLGEQLTEYIAKRDFIRDTFGRYVTQEVVKRLLESEGALELGGEIREVSILMSDLRGFTATTAEMKPEKVIAFLNRYLGKMIEVLTDHKAVIDEIIGDGILAFFGAPEPLENHAVQAVACALAMQRAMEEVNAENARDNLPCLQMGVAVGTGQVVVGNIGSATRTKYSVVGSPVNFVARMESFALGGQVLISTGTFSRIKDLVQLGEVLEVQMKGFPGQATLFEVVGLRGPYDLRLKPKQETLKPLAQSFPVRLYRIREKVVRGILEGACLTQLCETAATVQFQGNLEQWEDVRLKFLDETGQETPGKIYGKVMSVQPADDAGSQAHIRFTSVSPELSRLLQQAGQNDPG